LNKIKALELLSRMMGYFDNGKLSLDNLKINVIEIDD
jgi:hypothetical protein